MVAVALGSILVLVIAVWASWYFSAANTIARRVTDAHLPYVELVSYNINITLTESVAIFLAADTTDAQVSDLYCRIVTPAAASEVKPPGFLLIKGVHWWPSPRPGDDLENHGFSGGTSVEPPVCP